MKRVTFCQVLLYCALIVCTFLGNFKSFWKYKSMSFLIKITMLTNNSSICCNSLKFLHFDLLSGDGGTTTWTIFMCHLFCFSFCWWGLICRFILGTVFSFQVFFPTLNSLFVILFHFQERKKAQQACQLSRCYQESPSLNRFHRVYWIIKFFSQYCLPHASKQSIIWELFHLLSKAFYFFTYEIIHITESTAKLCRFKKYWIKHYGNRLGVFFIL